MPASAFSRSTESHNQDKVPMATIASRDALRVIELTEQVAAITTLAACQAIELRGPKGGCGGLHAAVRESVPVLAGDRRMDKDIRSIVGLIRDGSPGMSRPDHAVTVSLEIPFHDCDPLFVAWHGRYFQYLEAGRKALLSSFRLDVPDLVKMGYRLYVTDVRCRYLFPLTYDDKVQVSGLARPTLGSLLKIVYVVFNETRGRRAARAHTDPRLH